MHTFRAAFGPAKMEELAVLSNQNQTGYQAGHAVGHSYHGIEGAKGQE